MISLDLWRVRIGTFCFSSKVGSKHRPFGRNETHVKTTSVKNILLNYACLCALTAFLLCGKTVMDIAVTSPFIFQDVFDENGISYSETLVSSVNLTLPGSFAEDVSFLHEFQGYSGNCSTMTTQFMNSTYFFILILLSNDVQQNPGPNHNQSERKTTDDTMKRLEEKIDCKFSGLESKITELLVTVQSLSQSMGEQSERLKRMEEKFQRIEEDQKCLKESVSAINSDLATMKRSIEENQNDTNYKHDIMNETLSDLESEIDRLETFSRRNNVRLFGVNDRNEGPNEDCVKTVKDVLHEFLPEEGWNEDVIDRAHRLGRYNSQNPNPRPIIAKFQRWGDLMKLMKNREARDRMQESGLRISQDLTKRQSTKLRELKQEGKAGFYVNGRLHIRNHQDARGNPPRRGEAATRKGKAPSDPVSPKPINEQGRASDVIAASRESSPQHSSTDSTPKQDTRARTRSATSERQASLREAWGSSTKNTSRGSTRAEQRR